MEDFSYEAYFRHLPPWSTREIEQPTLARFEHGYEVWKHGGDEMLDHYEEVLAETLHAEDVGLIATWYWEDYARESFVKYYVVDWRRWKQTAPVAIHQDSTEDGEEILVPEDESFRAALGPIHPGWLQRLRRFVTRAEDRRVRKALNEKSTLRRLGGPSDEREERGRHWATDRDHLPIGTATVKVERTFQCPECGKRFYTPRDLDQHCSAKHGAE